MGIAEGKASALGYKGACPSRVRDTSMCLAGPHLPVFNSFSFTHPLKQTFAEHVLCIRLL